MTTAKTLANALAYIAITGHSRGLQIDTRIATHEFSEFKKTTNGFYATVINEAGMELARTSKLWKAHERIVAQGFSVNTFRKHKVRLITYVHPEMVETKSGHKVFRTAFTGKHGVVYIDRQNEQGHWVPTMEVL